MAAIHKSKCKCPNSPYYPPRDAWLIAPCNRLEKLPTPIDERGLVLIPDLIAAVDELVDPSFTWPLTNPPPDIHHAYWEAAWYPKVSRASIINPRYFRELPVHKVRVPRMFHNWLHLVTIPPKRPSIEVMAYRVEAFRVARQLFELASNALALENNFDRWAAQNGLTSRNCDDLFEDNFSQAAAGILGHLAVERAMAGEVPAEFRLVEPPMPGAALSEVAQTCGHVVAGEYADNIVPLITQGRSPRPGHRQHVA